MTQPNEQAFVDQIKRRLDKQADQLNELTIARLTAARLRAVDLARRPKNVWLPGVGIATAAALVLAVMMWRSPTDLPGPGPIEELDIVASGEDMELIEDLDFYAWLDATHSAG